MSTDVTDLIDRYCSVWNEPDAERREALLKSVWAGRAAYTDPRADTTGADELLAHIGRIQAGRPGARIVRTTAVDVHHGVARAAGAWSKPTARSRPRASTLRS